MISAFIFLAVFMFSEKIFCAVIGEKECSKFDYEYRVLERIIFFENKNQEMEKKQTVLERKNEELVEIIKEQRLEMERRDEEIETSLTSTINQTANEHSLTLQSKLEQFNDDQTSSTQKLRSDMEEKDKLQDDVQQQMKQKLDAKDKSQDDVQKQIKQELEAKDRSQDEDVRRLEASLATKINEITSGMSANRSNIFFTARLNSGRKFNYGETIVFGTIVSSEGGAYDSGTGVFTAPRKGVYLFSVTALVYNNGYANVYIRKNSDTIGSMVGDARRSGSGDSYYDTPSVTVVVELHEGDTVYAQCGSGSGYLHDGNTSFTGVLLYQRTQLQS